jgi:DNA-directed RNA polymerase specialized sigma24 family protein
MTPISEIIEEPFDCVDELQKKEFLDFIINKISNKTARQIVHDHVLGKQTYRQIAKKHGMSHENARKILKREFLKINNSLADENTVAN